MSPSMHLLENPTMNSPVQPHVRQAPIECYHVTGHQIELVNFKELFHLFLVFLWDIHRLAHFARTLVASRYHSYNRAKAKQNTCLIRINSHFYFPSQKRGELRSNHIEITNIQYSLSKFEATICTPYALVD